MSPVHVRVRAGGEHYALPVGDVLEVAPVGDLTPLPGAPATVLGVRNLRGQILPVIDLAALLGVVAAEPPARVVVAEAGALRAALAVEAVLGVGEVPPPTTPADSAALAGSALVDGELVGVVDVAAALGAVAGTPA